MESDTRKTEAQLPISDWQVGTLRLTTFLTDSLRSLETTWWSDILDVQAENMNQQTREGLRQEGGSFKRGELLLAVKLDRVDWHYIAKVDNVMNEEGFPTISDFPSSLEDFLPLMRQWLKLENCPSIGRMAFGAVLLSPVESLHNGYVKLLTHLPKFDLDPDSTQDFLYQVNRWRKSELGIPHLQVNRLSKWSVPDLVNIRFRTSKSSPKPTNLGDSHHFACRLDLDINTTQEFPDTLPQERLYDILDELVNFGKEIAEKGDVP